MRDTAVGTHGNGQKPTSGDQELVLILKELRHLSAKPDRLWHSATEIATSLRDRGGVRMHWRTIDSILGQQRQYTDRRKRQRRWEYLLLSYPGALDQSEQPNISLVDPTAAVQSTIQFHDLLASLRGVIRVCDPYLDHATLEHLEACPKGREIRLLTKNIKDSGALRRLHAAFLTQGHQLMVKAAVLADLHDRYIIDDAAMVILGTSLNGFGKKQCFVIRAGSDLRAVMLQEFDKRWAVGNPWP